MKRKHWVKCLKEHLRARGEYLLNGEGAKNEWWKAHGDAYLRVVDMLEGRITGDDCVFQDCLCKPKRKNAYNHYELAPSHGVKGGGK